VRGLSKAENERKDKQEPPKLLPVLVAEGDVEEEEGGITAKGNRSIEGLDTVVNAKSAKAEDLLPHGWAELCRLLIAERFKLPIETYFDCMAEVQSHNTLSHRAIHSSGLHTTKHSSHSLPSPLP
jgi:hypothetical protein